MEKNKTAIIAGVVALIIGLIIGSASSGKKGSDEKDAKALLQQAIEGIGQMEIENKNLRADLLRAGKDTVTKENKSLKEEVAKTKEENAEFKNQIQVLQGRLASMTAQLQSTKNQGQRIAQMEKENKELSLLLDKINTISKGQKSVTPVQPEKEVHPAGPAGQAK